jgi:hypothetical protein
VDGYIPLAYSPKTGIHLSVKLSMHMIHMDISLGGSQMLAYTAAFFAFLKLSLTVPTSVKNTLLLISLSPHRIFGHLLWEFPHYTKNITYFGNFHNINYSHTLSTSLQLHHHTTIGPPSYISSSLVYIHIT